MTTEACHIVEELLADDGLEALREKPAAAAHLRTCADCRALLLALQELDGQLATLPSIEPAPEVLARALAAVGVAEPRPVDTHAAPGPQAPDVRAPEPAPSPIPATPTSVSPPVPERPLPAPRAPVPALAGRPPAAKTPGRAPAASRLKRRLPAAVWISAAGVLGLALMFSIWGIQLKGSDSPNAVYEEAVLQPNGAPADAPAPTPMVVSDNREGEDNARAPRGNQPEPGQQEAGRRSEPGGSETWRAGDDLLLGADAQAQGQPPPETPPVVRLPRRVDGTLDLTTADVNQAQPRNEPEALASVGQQTERERPPVTRPSPTAMEIDAENEVELRRTPREVDISRGPGQGTFDLDALDPCPTCDIAELPTAGLRNDEGGRFDNDGEGYGRGEGRGRPGWWAQPIEESEALALLSRWDATEGLAFQQPTGYWANTYVPGDPIIRELQQRLVRAESDASLAAYGGPSGRSLAEASQTYTQPFDPPRGSALALYLATDRDGVSDPSRVLLQVGLQGTARQTGRRPAMQVAVVLDLRTVPGAAASAQLESLLLALADARDIGDGFSLFVAGRTGGLVIPAGSFRYGPVSLACAQLLRGEAGPRLGDATVSFDLPAALAAAAEQLGTASDPDAPLGTSAILLVTIGTLGADLADLEALAHTSAVAGIPVSAIGVGPAVDIRELDNLALAGQGNRRLLDSADEAEDLILRELAAASRAVARAVRLRIRLAPGVQLVDVLGSRRLDEEAAQRVREAEQSIDQRLARSLGIAADRGEDEEGIQIVIPAFYAEDSHVILLDLVVPGPGPVADVTVRYKDLVFSRNAVARDSLALPHGDGGRGPLELSVLKNRLAHEVSVALRAASTFLAGGEDQSAIAALYEAIWITAAATREVPGLATDAEIRADVALLESYAATLERVLAAGRPLDDLTDSLLYASYLKILPPPAAE